VSEFVRTDSEREKKLHKTMIRREKERERGDNSEGLCGEYVNGRECMR
jgi:hypothetical protein